MPKAILVPSTVDQDSLSELFNIPVSTPLRGKKRAMLELCEKNAKLALDESFRLNEMRNQKTIGASQELANYLDIPQASHIESFDHSNIQGTSSVSGMVVYKDGVPDRKSYRKFKIKTSQGANEFANTQEVIRRRYTRLLREEKALPDLILMDGGIVQVRAARDVIENELGLAIPVAGMIKDDHHRTASLLDGYREEIVDMDQRSQAFHLLQRIQEEVHRYAISYHRQVRSKAQYTSRLDQIPGVGPKTRTKLLKQFKSLKNIQKATLEEITRLGIPRPVAQRILDDLNK